MAASSTSAVALVVVEVATEPRLDGMVSRAVRILCGRSSGGKGVCIHREEPTLIHARIAEECRESNKMEKKWCVRRISLFEDGRVEDGGVGIRLRGF